VLLLDANASAASRHAMAVRDLRDTARLWRLCWTLAVLDIRQRYRGSVLGPFWLTLSTALMVVSMGIVYSVLFGLKLHDYMPYLALSLVLWAFLGTLTVEACGTYTLAEGMIRAMRMPYALHAVRIVLRNIMVLGHNVVVIVLVDLALWSWPGAIGLLAIPALLIWVADAMAVTLLLGALCARFRDIPPIVASVMQMAFFLSAVIWKPSQLGQQEWLMAFNPFFSILEIVRGPLQGEVPSLAVYASALAYTAVMAASAWFLFVRARGRLAFWV
jgi:lipopolysaccharide transport system permease protein